MLGYDAFRAEQARGHRARAATSASGSRSTSSRRPASAPTPPSRRTSASTPTGRVDVFIGTGAHGQGLETTIAQLVAEDLGVDIDDVTVRQGDTAARRSAPAPAAAAAAR